ncbi:MAG: hypothetical protein GXO33_08005 [Epsilonproteobacteria bacterium]|nr:hypothetical protein [Campylobacterota bacterium]
MRILLLLLVTLTALLARGGYDASTLLPDIQRLERERAETVADLLTRLPGLKPTRHAPFAAKDLLGNLPLYTLASYTRHGPLALYDHPRIPPYTACGFAWRRIGPVTLQMDCDRPVSTRVLLLDTRSAFEYLSQAPSVDNLSKTKQKRALMPLFALFQGTDALDQAVRRFAEQNPFMRLPSQRQPWCDAPGTPRCAMRLKAIEKAWEPVLQGFKHFHKTAFAPLRHPPFITLDPKLHTLERKNATHRPPQRLGGFAASSNAPAKHCKEAVSTLQLHEDDPANSERVSDFFTLCRHDPTAVPHLPNLGKPPKLNKKALIPALLIVATQYGFHVTDPKARYTFETILQKLVKKGRAKKVSFDTGPYWSAALELLGKSADPKGWRIYADPEDRGGAVLYHTKTGKGVWQPAHFLALPRLATQVGQLNQEGARLFALMRRYHRLTLKKADKGVSRTFVKKEEAADEAF